MNDIDEQIEYGLDDVDPDRTISVNLKDLLYVFETMQELNSFFHQEMHWQSLEDVIRFIGDIDEGAYKAISNCIYRKLSPILPADIQAKYDEGDFDCPNLPFYKY